MIQNSLIVGTLWLVLQKMTGALSASPLGHAFAAVCRWIGGQWDESVIVTWFCSPRYLADKRSREPGRVRRTLCVWYERLGL